MIQVSIIVATYNPDPCKLRATLNAAVKQREIEFEIIVTDDGSAQKDFSWLPDYFEINGIKQYSVIENPVNIGTVANILAGVRVAKGEYIFLTSPGDLLFDENVLRDFYAFAKDGNYKLCFGNAVFYSAEAQFPQITRKYGIPCRPQLYLPTSPWGKLNFFCGDWVIGASYFRERESARIYLEEVGNICKYVEDTTSTAYAFANCMKLYYNDRNMVWYEDGTGVSTSKSEKWNGILLTDIKRAFYKLKKEFPQDPMVDIAYINLAADNRKKRIMKKLLKHPIAMIQFAILKMCSTTRPVEVGAGDLQRLQGLLKEEREKNNGNYKI